MDRNGFAPQAYSFRRRNHFTCTQPRKEGPFCSMTSAQAVPLASWVFVAVSVASGWQLSLTFSLSNGTLFQQSTPMPNAVAINHTTQQVWLSTRPSDPTPLFMGLVSDLRFWPRVLQYQDLQQLMLGTAPNVTSPGPGVIGGTAFDGYSLTLQCPPGYAAISAISFASYGMPLGVFPTFSLGAYHAANSSAIVNDRCLPRSFCNLTVTTALFGDPFPGQQKHLSVVATCSRVKTSTIIRRPRGPASTSSGSVASSSPSLLSTTRPLPTSLRGSKSATSYSRLSAAAAMRSTHAPRPPPSSQVSSNSPNVSMSVIVVAGAVTAIVIILGLCFCATFHAGRFASIRKQDSDQRRPAPSFPVGIPTRPVAISNVYDPAMFAGGRYPVVAPTSQGMVNMPPTWPNHLPSLSDADHHLSPSRRFRRSEAVDKFNNGARTLTTSSDTEYG